MKKSVKENKRKNSFTKRNKKSKSRTLKNTNKIQKGGTSYSIGVIEEQSGYVKGKTISDKFNGLPSEIEISQSLPILHITNLENAFTSPNKDPNFTYHSLFLSYIDGNINDLDVIKWSINKFLNDLLIKINKEK